METTVTPTISLVIPTYGRALYLQNLITSVRESTPADVYEIIVVSSDLPDSEKLVWLSQQPDVRVLSRDPRGPNDKRKKSLYHYTNLGIYEATKEWIFVVNDDMVFDPDWYNAFTRILAKPEHTNIGMVIVATHIGDVGLGSRIAAIGKTKKTNGPWKDLYLADLGIIHRDTMRAIGYFDEHMDWFGSGADNALAIEFLTDQTTILGPEIKVDHYITQESRAAVPGNAFNDFNYITNKWRKWCKEHNADFVIDFGVAPYTLINRIKNFVRSILHR